MEILRVENLTFTYPQAHKPALEKVSLSLDRGEFVVLAGASGCGKTTLLKLLKPELAPVGEIEGQRWLNGQPLEQVSAHASASEIGFVLQNPDNQLVTDKVWHELAFGLENLGVPTDIIRRRVGEMASYFGIQDWFRKSTAELSGGQKQLLNLAAVMVMQPQLLLLDEPTGQLDPIAASDFIATLHKLNRELGLTIVLVEHRLEEVLPLADKVILMDDGRLLLSDTPRQIGPRLHELHPQHPLLAGLPTAVRLYHALSVSGECPLTVKEGRDWLDEHFPGESTPAFVPPYQHSKETAIQLNQVWFRYEKEASDVLRGTDLSVYQGEFFGLLGGNGSGKTTLLNVVAGLDRPYRGHVRINGKLLRDYKGQSLYRNNLALLPQNPQTLFLKDRVDEDWDELLQVMGTPKAERETIIREMAERLNLTELLFRHPYDLSGGEQQKCALGKVLLTQPKILLLDEPTKGLDADSKQRFGTLLKQLQKDGLTLLIVTHDVEFAAEYTDRCALFFDGESLSADVPQQFFSENNFYTTAANRMARHRFPYAVTCGQVEACCQQQEGGAV